MSLARSAAVAVQLALVYLVCQRFQVESRELRDVLLLSSLGWLGLHFVPPRLRLAAFLAVAVACVAVVFGLRDGAWLLGIAGLFIAACVLPASRRLRLALVLVLAALLAWLRAGPIDAPFSLPVWPILASLFLFRAISFLYDRHHEREAPPAGLAVAYFLLPPNVALPVFPVVDFAALRRGYDPEAGPDVHQEGVERIVRGLLQLLAYRVVYHRAVIPIDAVDDSWSAVQHLVTNVFLIVRVMGMFHVSVGLLHLFGFRLPPTTHLPFLAPGFSEFWRRANVYWRDFVVKVFFYPAYFRFKGWGRRPAQAVAVAVTFAAAWFLHSYQWFWFQGDFPLRWQDGVYWAAFGLLVMANGLWASREGARRAGGGRLGPAGELARAARIAGTFASFAVLWSIWMTPTWGDWLGMWSALAGDGLAALVPVGLMLGAVALAGLLWPDATPAARGALAGRPGWAPWGRPWRHAPAVLVPLLALLAVAPPTAGKPLPGWLRAAVAAMAETSPNVHDARRATEGYYQELVEIPRLDVPEWRRRVEKPDDWVNWHTAGLSEPVGDVRRWVYRPSTSRVFKGARLTTNARGMRDREYPRAKPPGVLRVALLGASPAAGSGVDDGETFEALLERELAARAAAAGGPGIEILNFAVPGFKPLRWLEHLEKVALDFQPDWVVVAAAAHVWWDAPSELASAQRNGVPIDQPSLRALAEACEAKLRGRGGDVDGGTLRHCLEPEAHAMLRLVAHAMRRAADERGFGLVYLEIPTFGTQKALASDDFLADLAAEGFVHVDVSECWDRHPESDLRVASWDFHPNALAHALVAECAREPLAAILLASPSSSAAR